MVPLVKDMIPAKPCLGIDDKNATMIAVGNRTFYVMELPTTTKRSRFFLGPLVDVQSTLKTAYGGKEGVVSWSGTVNIPILTEPNGTPHGKVWMSLTPMEVFTQRPGLRHARGKVLVGGLGMGWFARRVLEKRGVTHVTIADIDATTLGYFGKPLKEEFGSRVTLVQEDVYKLPRTFDSYLLDIWPGDLGCYFDPQFLDLAISEKNVWGWGNDWRSKVAAAKQTRKAA